MDVSKTIVGTDEIENGAVTNAKLANESVTDQKVQAGVGHSKILQIPVHIMPEKNLTSSTSNIWQPIADWTVASAFFGYERKVILELIAVPGEIGQVTGSGVSIGFFRGADLIAEIRHAGPASMFRAIDLIGPKVTAFDYSVKFRSADGLNTTTITKCQFIAHEK